MMARCSLESPALRLVEEKLRGAVVLLKNGLRPLGGSHCA